MHIPLDRSSAVPLAQQIRQYLGKLIHGGLLASGVKLPATRDLAESLHVDRSTVARAYDALVAQGLLVSRVGQGTFVAPEGSLFAVPVSRSNASFDWSGMFSKASHLLASDPGGMEAGDGSRKSGTISFAGGIPDRDLFPTEAFRQGLKRGGKGEGGAPS